VSGHIRGQESVENEHWAASDSQGHEGCDSCQVGGEGPHKGVITQEPETVQTQGGGKRAQNKSSPFRVRFSAVQHCNSGGRRAVGATVQWGQQQWGQQWSGGSSAVGASVLWGLQCSGAYSAVGAAVQWGQQCSGGSSAVGAAVQWGQQCSGGSSAVEEGRLSAVPSQVLEPGEPHEARGEAAREGVAGQCTARHRRKELTATV